MLLSRTESFWQRWARRALGAAIPLCLLTSGAFSLGCGTRDHDKAYDREVHALALRIEALPSNAALSAEVERRLPRVRNDPARVIGETSEKVGALALGPPRVPGLFYRSHAWTGADLAGVSAWLGREVVLVETGEVDTVTSN